MRPPNAEEFHALRVALLLELKNTAHAEPLTQLKVHHKLREADIAVFTHGDGEASHDSGPLFVAVWKQPLEVGVFMRDGERRMIRLTERSVLSMCLRDVEEMTKSVSSLDATPSKL